ncbi:hypothetical protein OU5_0694 [Pseudomonas mandelii JR-1]|uniref:Uncharacterized protein n=1 Tax=Pseudomonas mandelii JR-1 TaxID=1147786 RepID=A0A024E645_9PSED|nr:twin-arginine translocation signal domain-containing protein [Pseudomonas mandelii]AHZ67773.1 hypothetical protein OU5_0694 [Pseudomonas mandelii JR-1]
MNSINPVSRRGFLKGSALLGGGLVVAFVIPGARAFVASELAPARRRSRRKTS